jgi:thioredoxin 1
MTVTPIPNLATYRSILSANRVVIVDFWAEWCGPCRMIKPRFEALSAQYPQVKCVSVNVDEAAEVAQAEGVRAMPTFALFYGGKKVRELVGADPSALANAFAELAQKPQL